MHVKLLLQKKTFQALTYPLHPFIQKFLDCLQNLGRCSSIPPTEFAQSNIQHISPFFPETLFPWTSFVSLGVLPQPTMSGFCALSEDTKVFQGIFSSKTKIQIINYSVLWWFYNGVKMHWGHYHLPEQVQRLHEGGNVSATIADK